MFFVWHASVSAAVIAAWLIVVRNGGYFRATTLSSAWRWSVVAASSWLFAWFSDSCLNRFSPAAADHLWYGCAVVTLCPPICVLGSRRPGTRVWTPFIVFPMLLAMSWPLLALRLQGSEFRGLQLESPQLIAFTLVLIMGVGNYCGTKFTLSALIYGVASLAIVAACSQFENVMPADRVMIREWSTLGIALAVCLLTRASPTAGTNRFDRIWFDFFDTFGIVWGRRIQDRVNFVARDQGWPVRLELEGFVAVDPSIPFGLLDSIEPGSPERECDRTGVARCDTEMVNARIEHTLRWLLRRFVDPIWIDARLETRNVNQSVEAYGIRIDS